MLALVAVSLFASNAMAGLIMNSTETFPLTNPTWGQQPADPAGWTKAQASWGKFACTFGGSTTVASHTADGSQILRMKWTGGGSGVAAIQFTSTPGATYTLSGYVQRNDVRGWTEFQLVDGADWSGWDTGGVCDVINVPAAGTWYSFGKSVQATGTTMTILLKGGHSSGSTLAIDAYWDDITVTPEPVTLLMLAPSLLLLRRRRT